MSDNLDYLAFLRRKIKLASFAGFDIADDEINPILKPHQRACVKWAVRGGNRALFERFGLGKSVQQLEIVRLVMSKAGGPTAHRILRVCAAVGEVKRTTRRVGRVVSDVWEIAE